LLLIPFSLWFKVVKDNPMRIKTPQTITTFPHDGQIVVYNYLTKDAITCSANDVYWLSIAPTWTSIDEIALAHPHIAKASLITELKTLVDAGILLQEGTPNAEQEASYTELWELGRATAMYHFSALDNEFADISVSVEKQKLRALTCPSPPLYTRNGGQEISLPSPSAGTESYILNVMKKRRTNRDVEPCAISLKHLSDCLYSGLGITGFVQTETSLLPLKMTPSGGARNPFEAFIWVRNVDGLKPGFYHYSALDHTLGRLPSSTNQSPGKFLANQSWADDMSAIVFLTADFRRTTWKYNDPNAYRVVMIEAGHIAQNIMLTCTENELTACPTAALCHTAISELLGFKNLTQTPIYALAIGKPKTYADVIINPEIIKHQHAQLG
jgi:SagB-type dehydrogenase family enzyme